MSLDSTAKRSRIDSNLNLTGKGRPCDNAPTLTERGNAMYFDPETKEPRTMAQEANAHLGDDETARVVFDKLINAMSLLRYIAKYKSRRSHEAIRTDAEAHILAEVLAVQSGYTVSFWREAADKSGKGET